MWFMKTHPAKDLKPDEVWMHYKLQGNDPSFRDFFDHFVNINSSLCYRIKVVPVVCSLKCFLVIKRTSVSTMFFFFSQALREAGNKITQQVEYVNPGQLV